MQMLKWSREHIHLEFCWYEKCQSKYSVTRWELQKGRKFVVGSFCTVSVLCLRQIARNQGCAERTPRWVLLLFVTLRLGIPTGTFQIRKNGKWTCSRDHFCFIDDCPPCGGRSEIRALYWTLSGSLNHDFSHWSTLALSSTWAWWLERFQNEEECVESPEFLYVTYVSLFIGTGQPKWGDESS